MFHDEERLCDNYEDIMKIVPHKISESIAYLSQCFGLNIRSRFLEVVLHVRSKECATFFALPILQQREVIRASFTDFDYDRNGKINPVIPEKTATPMHRALEMLLCMACYLEIHNEMVHFGKLFSFYYTSVGNTKFLKPKSQFQFFKCHDDIFLISENGFVGLPPLPTLKFDYSEMIPQKNVTHIPEPEGSNISLNDGADTSPKESVTTRKGKQLKVASRIFNLIKDSIVFLNKVFKVVSTEHVIKSIFHANQELSRFFASDSQKVQKKLYLLFEEENNKFHHSSNSSLTVSHLTREKKTLLSLVYVLVKSRKMLVPELFEELPSENKTVHAMSFSEKYNYLTMNKTTFLIDESCVYLKNNRNCERFHLEEFLTTISFSSKNASVELEDKKVNIDKSEDDPSSNSLKQDMLCKIYEYSNFVLNLNLFNPKPFTQTLPKKRKITSTQLCESFDCLQVNDCHSSRKKVCVEQYFCEEDSVDISDQALHRKVVRVYRQWSLSDSYSVNKNTIDTDPLATSSEAQYRSNALATSSTARYGFDILETSSDAQYGLNMRATSSDAQYRMNTPETSDVPYRFNTLATSSDVPYRFDTLANSDAQYRLSFDVLNFGKNCAFLHNPGTDSNSTVGKVLSEPPKYLLDSDTYVGNNKPVEKPNNILANIF